MRKYKPWRRRSRKTSNKIMFRFEIWANSNIPEEELSKTKNFYGQEFGCTGIFVKDIKEPTKK